MDLLTRKASTASRRGTLLPGGARRNGTSGSASATATTPSSMSKKTSALFNEFRAHEEAVAACVIQRAARAFLSRRFLAKLLQQVYRRVYDPIAKRYVYLNTNTNETTWERPRALQLFLAESQDVAVASSRRSDLPPPEAARRIQRAARTRLARRRFHTLVRETYMKLFDSETQTFYYLNTRTGERARDRPTFLGKDDADDLPVETFAFRKAVCKVSSSTNLYGSGVLGYFGLSTRWLCLLSDATTLPDAATAGTAHVVCNFTPDPSSVPFQIALCPESFFTTLTLDKSATSTPQFALCAVDRAVFLERAGTNMEPLSLEMNDRKLGCADATGGGVRIHDVVEMVGHPHGKPRVVHTRTLAKMVPHSIAPVQMVLDRETETGAAGCALFTRGGKLLGLQPFAPLKQSAPRAFYYIRPILAAAHALVTPPDPFLLTTRLACHEVHACWSIVRWFKPLPGLAIAFELELGHPGVVGSYTAFTNVYTGAGRSKHVGGLTSDSVYSLRVRTRNAMAVSAWSHVLTFRTLPTPSLAWRIPRYCSSVRDACVRMAQQRQDVQAQVQGVQWIARHLDQHPESAVETEATFLEAKGLDWMLDTITSRFPESHALVVLTLRVLTTLTRLQRRTQRLLSQVQYMETVVGLLTRHLPVCPDSHETERAGGPEDGLAISLTCVELLGAVLDGDDPSSAQQTAQAIEIVPTLLVILSRDENRLLQHHAPFVAECVFLFARYTHNHTLSGKRQLVDDGRLAVLRDLLLAYTASGASTIVYWTLLTIGNLAYASLEPTFRHELELETHALQLVAAVCDARTQYLLKVHKLQLAVGVAEREFARLAASVMGETMRNEMDACEHEIETLRHAIQQLSDNGDVALAADFALRYLLTDDQRRVQAAAKRLMQAYLLRHSAAAFDKWFDATVFDRHCGVVRKFLTAVKNRQLSAAFRKWEAFLRDWRKHHQSVLVDAVLGAGLAIDLNKRKRERYRILALQK